MLLGDIHDYTIDIVALVSTRYSVFSLSHLDLGYKTFLYMFVGSTNLSYSLASCCIELCWKLDCFKNGNGRNRARSISGLLRDPSKDDFENNRKKQFNTNSRAGEMSVENVRRNT